MYLQKMVTKLHQNNEMNIYLHVCLYNRNPNHKPKQEIRY